MMGAGGTGAVSPQLAILLVLAGVAIGYLLGLFLRTRRTNSRIIGTLTSRTQHTSRHATVVMKRKGKAGQAPVHYYMVGPVREREKEAVEDLVRWQTAATTSATEYQPPNTWPAPPPPPPRSAT